MKITICGSVAFAEEIVAAQEKLEAKGIETVVPNRIENYLGDTPLKQRVSGWSTIEGAQRKRERNLIKGYYEEIAKSDAILVINQEKMGIKNYIGGNSFLEMGFAYILNKPIYLLNPIPDELKIFYEEVVAMQPIILNGDLDSIPLL